MKFPVRGGRVPARQIRLLLRHGNFEHRRRGDVYVLRAQARRPPHAQQVPDRDISVGADENPSEPEHAGAGKSRNHSRGRRVGNLRTARAKHRAQAFDLLGHLRRFGAACAIGFHHRASFVVIGADKILPLSRRTSAGLEIPVVRAAHLLLRECAGKARKRARGLEGTQPLRKLGVQSLRFEGKALHPGIIPRVVGL